MDILEAVHYEKLWKETTSFVVQTVLPHLKQMVDAKDSDVSSMDIYTTTMQVTTAIPRLYLMGTACGLVLKDLNRFRNKLKKNAEYASTLEKKKQPSTIKAIRKAKQEILEEINDLCNAI